MTMIATVLFVIMIVMKVCSSSSSNFMDKLRQNKMITFQSSLSSPLEITVNEGSKFRLTCSFLSNFDQLDIFLYHNGSLIQSFLSKSIVDEEDDEVENSFLAVTIVSSIEIEKIHFDMNGIYQCVGIHNDISARQAFLVHVNNPKKNSLKTNLNSDILFTVHTYQALFEPRTQTTLMCRFNNNRKEQCSIQWYDPNFESLEVADGQTDLVLKDATFEENMGLYSCQICCKKNCHLLTTFVYPAGADN